MERRSKHSHETRRAFRILIVGKFLIYKTGTGECGRYRFGQVPHLCVSFKNKYSIVEEDNDKLVKMKRERKRERARESEREREKEREREH